MNDKALPSFLFESWDYDKNTDISLDNISVGTGKNAWFKCRENHNFSKEIRRFIKDPSCPYCLGYKAIPGKTDLLTVKIDIGKQWHPTKNESLDPSTILPGSHKLVWWQCEKGHEWKTSIKSRCNDGRGCPYCGKRFAVEGVNDLLTLYPDIAVEWHPTKNGNKTPGKTKPGSSQKVWWKCDKSGHEWQTSPNNRVGLGNGCPYCSGFKILKGFNDLITRCPKLAEEWHPTKNELDPYQISSGSRLKAWWVCEKNHEWKAAINNRANANAGCPECARGKNSSKLEKEIANFLRENYTGIIKTNDRTILKPREIDILLEDKQFAIEINGTYWHSISLGRVDKEYHFSKWEDCLKQNINLIQIWDSEYSDKSELIKERLLVALTKQRFTLNNTEIEMHDGRLKIFKQNKLVFCVSYLFNNKNIELFDLVYKEKFAGFDWVALLTNFFISQEYSSLKVTIENDWSTDADYLKSYGFELDKVLSAKKIRMRQHDVYNSGYSVYIKSLR